MDQEKNLIKNPATPHAFIPHHLHIKNNPGLNFFPFNVMFMSYKRENNKIISGHSLYYPELDSYEINKNGCLMMRYLNIYGGECWLVITYNPENNCYSGIKWKKDEIIDGAMAEGWNMFFAKFTAMGLAKGERCKFEEVK